MKNSIQEYIVAELINGRITLFPRLGFFRPTWVQSNIADLMNCNADDVDFEIDNYRDLAIEEAEAKAIEITEKLTSLEARNLTRARQAWVDRFNG